MPLSKKQTRITPLSKIVITTIALCFIVFLSLGYKKSLRESNIPSPNGDIQLSNRSQQITQPAGLPSYVNRIAGYSFQYTTSEVVESAGGYEETPEESDTIIVVNKADNNGLMDISVNIPPTCCFKNEREALQEIVGYYSGSTSQYLRPELNKVTGPTLTTKIKYPSDQPIRLYRYEVNWDDGVSGRKGKGTDVWLFIPVTVNWRLDPDRLDIFDNKYTFLWINYDKKNEKRVLPILDSFSLRTSF